LRIATAGADDPRLSVYAQVGDHRWLTEQGLFVAEGRYVVQRLLEAERLPDPLHPADTRCIPERVIDWPSGLEPYRVSGFTLVALTTHPDAQPLASFARAIIPRLILLAGSEGPGLSGAALALADARVRIPMAPGVDSLNVIVAAGIALSHLSI